MTPRTRTFLFTDIEGSTSLVEAHADTWADALADHRRIMRRICAEHHGDEVRTTGDGYFAEFADADDAVAAAVEAQIALRANPWPVGLELQVRMGLHTGDVDVDGGELVGLAVHEAARVCAAAHGGQILMTGETCRAAGETVASTSLGRFALRGVSAPVELHQVSDPRLPDAFPPPHVGAPDAAKAGVVRVVIVDDQEMVRTGFRLILGATDGLQVVGEASNGLDAIDVVAAVHPDVVLMDIRMPQMNGIEATQALTSRPGAPRVVILTTFDLDEYVYDALRAGASGFMLKDAPPADVVRAIQVVAAGESLLAPSITRKLIGEFTRANAPTPTERRKLAGLSDREAEVLTHIAHGLTNAELAETLFISEATVKTHVRNLLAKLDARDRVQLVVLAYEAGLVTPGE